MLCFLPLHLLRLDPAGCRSWACMDEQHIGLCLPIPVAGNLFRSISLLMFIYIQFTIVTNIRAACAVHPWIHLQGGWFSEGQNWVAEGRKSQREGGERSCGSAGNLKLLTCFICVIINHLMLRHWHDKLHSVVLCRTCMRNCFLLLCPLRQCLAWAVLHLRWVGWACLQWVEWVCRQWALVRCQHSGCHRWEATELFLQRA